MKERTKELLVERKDHRRLVDVLLAEHGRTYCDELGINIARGAPVPLFRWLCCSLLFSARINAGLAVQAGKALAAQGWTNAKKLGEAGWERRMRVLNEAGYGRYDESTSRYFGELAEHLNERYRGDLRRLRRDAGQEPAKERSLLGEFKGVGRLGVDIFCREAQICWPELYPFADSKALGAARKLGLPATSDALAALAGRDKFPVLIASLVRADLAKSYKQLKSRALSR